MTLRSRWRFFCSLQTYVLILTEQKNPQAVLGSSRHGNEPPTILMGLHFTPKLADQVVLHCQSDLPWRSIPGSACTTLPYVVLKIAEPGKNGVQIRLNGFRSKTLTDLLPKDR